MAAFYNPFISTKKWIGSGYEALHHHRIAKTESWTLQKVVFNYLHRNLSKFFLFRNILFLISNLFCVYIRIWNNKLKFSFRLGYSRSYFEINFEGSFWSSGTHFIVGNAWYINLNHFSFSLFYVQSNASVSISTYTFFPIRCIAMYKQKIKCVFIERCSAVTHLSLLYALTFHKMCTAPSKPSKWFSLLLIS